MKGGCLKYLTQAIAKEANNAQFINELPRLPKECNTLIMKRVGYPKELEVNRERIEKAIKYRIKNNPIYRDTINLNQEKLKYYDKITNLA